MVVSPEKVMIIEEITKILTEAIGDIKIENILEKSGTLYVMAEVQSKIEDNLANEIEKDIANRIKAPVKLCLTYTKKNNSGKKNLNKKKKIEGVENVIIICSGKGGVGKSTISAHIAYYLMEAGYKVGLFDSDIYGPSIPKIFDIKSQVEIDSGKFIPHERFGIKLMSMGFIIEADDALVWRGPMVTKTLNQMLLQTDWGKLDYLIIDTPPGTGDVHLSLAENYEIDGAIIVSSPQTLAIVNSHRSLDMLQKLDIKLFGVVENMAYIENSDGSKNYIFGKGNLEKYANDRSLPILATLPLIPEISNCKIVTSLGRFFEKLIKTL
jgi:ATP-binding protein involved in chromosome partitioning